MAKRRPPPPRRKNERDKKIDAVLRVADARLKSGQSGTMIVSKTDLRDAAVQTSVKTATVQTKAVGPTMNRIKAEKGKPARAATAPVTAMAIALSNAGLAPHSKPPLAPEKAATPAEPVRVKPPVPAKKFPPSHPVPSKAGKAKKPKDRVKAKTRLAVPIQKPAQPWPPKRDRPAIQPKAQGKPRTDRTKAAAEFIARISRAHPDEILEIWRENVGRINDKKGASPSLARDYITAIEGEWQRRSILARLDPDYFRWPSTKATPGNGTFAALDYAEGILGYLGYHVGKTGEQSSSRRQGLLARVFEGALPPINGPDYMRDWDRSGSAIRLKKLADSIASFVQSAKRRREADCGVAIEHWEDDLKFLHRAYYVGRFRFDWPGGTS